MDGTGRQNKHPSMKQILLYMHRVIALLRLYTVSRKHPSFYFLNSSVKKITDFNNFGKLNPEKILT